MKSCWTNVRCATLLQAWMLVWIVVVVVFVGKEVLGFSTNIILLRKTFHRPIIIQEGRSRSRSRSIRIPTDVQSTRIRQRHGRTWHPHAAAIVPIGCRKHLVVRRASPYDEYEDEYDKDEDEDDDEIQFDKYQVDPNPTMSSPPQQHTVSASTSTSTSDMDTTQSQIEQQQKQIDMLLQMVQNQNQNQNPPPSTQQQSQPQPQPPQRQQQQQQQTPRQSPFSETTSNYDDDFLPPPIPGMFDDEGEEELLDYEPQDVHSRTNRNRMETGQPNGVLPVAPLKAMLFIDGTWLYYSLYRRKEELDPIVKKFGKGWPYRYRFDWNALPRIVCEQIVGQQRNLGWSSSGSSSSGSDDTISLQSTAERPVEIVRASVFTSYKKTTDPKSFRARMYNEMADANYDIHMLESTSNGPEKCVDISLAVEMLHYATVPNAYDVAILLSGDKDFIPAMVRTRQKGRKVGVVSMRTGCNRALYEGSHIKDFDVVWIDDFLDRLLVPLPPDQLGKNVQSLYDRGMLSVFTLTKVILDFISQSPYGKVSSRDVGRYLKNLELPGGTSLLDDVKMGQGGLRRFLQDRMPMVFEVTDRSGFQYRDPNDKSYWIAKKEGTTDILLQEAKKTTFTDEEKSFLQDYQSGAIDRGAEEDIYYYTIYALEIGALNGEVPAVAPSEPVSYMNEEIDYSTWTVVRLKAQCRELGLPVSGTKAALIERIQEAENKGSKKQARGANNDSSTESSGKDNLEKYLIDLVKYYIQESGGYASSRDLGRFLATNQRSAGSNSRSALQELKNAFGGVAAFLNQRSDTFTTVREASDGDPMNYSFGIKLKDATSPIPPSRSSLYPPPPPNSSSNTNPPGSYMEQNTDQKLDAHIEALLREYLHASGGEASSRNIGRYLSANAALETAETSGTNSRRGDKRNSALKQLKSHYGSLAAYLNTKEDTFVKISSGFRRGQGEMDAPSDHEFGVRLKK